MTLRRWIAGAAGVKREGDRAVMPVLFVSSEWAGTGDRDLNFAIACGLPDAPTTPVFGSAMDAVAWRRSTPKT